jgi:hypothetical protein
MVPVAQNEHCLAQPTWLETQTVCRVRELVSWWWRITTVSTRCPSCSCTTSLKPPSDGTLSTTRLLRSVKCCASSPRTLRGRSVGSMSSAHSEGGAPCENGAKTQR